MTKTKSLLILLTIVCSVLVLFYAIQGNNTTQNAGGNQPENQSESDSPPSEGPEFVIPQSPLGTLGLISASATGFAIFLVIKKRK